MEEKEEEVESVTIEDKYLKGRIGKIGLLRSAMALTPSSLEADSSEDESSQVFTCKTFFLKGFLLEVCKNMAEAFAMIST